ncbi:MAG: extracellular solute-binding protein [Acidobacteriota bacterium]
MHPTASETRPNWLFAARRACTVFTASAALIFLAACGGSTNETAPAEESATAQDAAASETLTVYSGRNESLIQPIIDRFSEQSGVEVKVRYGGTAELAATLLEEGSASPADVFIGQDLAALGALAQAGLFQPLPQEILDRVPARFRGPEGRWIGLSGRARVVVYNTDALTADQLPASLEEVGDSRFSGRFGVAPNNGSFQAHMAVYREIKGEEALAALLKSFAENDAQIYPKNSAIVEAVITGEIDFGLVNHYYLMRALNENPEAPGANFVQSGEAASFVNLAGTGIIDSGSAEAAQLVDFLTSDEAQTYFSTTTFEYPVIASVTADSRLTPLEELPSPDVNFGAVSDGYEAALDAIAASDLTP